MGDVSGQAGDFHEEVEAEAVMVRVKFRYIISQIKLDGRKKTNIQANGSDVFHCIKKSVETMYGDYGVGILQSTFNVKHFQPLTGTVLIRVSRAYCKMLLAAVATIQTLGSQSVLFHTIHVAGTIRSCQKAMVKYHQSQLPAVLAACSTHEERQKVQEMFLSRLPMLEERAFKDRSLQET